MTDKQGKDTKKVEEYEAGRINFENVLQDDIRQANNFYRNGNFVKFCLSVQTIWQNAMRPDKEAILKLTKERENERSDNTLTKGYQRQSMNVNSFLRLMEANPKRHSNRFTKRKIPKWREIFQLIVQGLRRRYYGKNREWKKDKLSA